MTSMLIMCLLSDVIYGFMKDVGTISAGESADFSGGDHSIAMVQCGGAHPHGSVGVLWIVRMVTLIRPTRRIRYCMDVAALMV
jgi:hypothetical protein